MGKTLDHSVYFNKITYGLWIHSFLWQRQFIQYDDCLYQIICRSVPNVCINIYFSFADGFRKRAGFFLKKRLYAYRAFPTTLCQIKWIVKPFSAKFSMKSWQKWKFSTIGKSEHIVNKLDSDCRFSVDTMKSCPILTINATFNKCFSN